MNELEIMSDTSQIFQTTRKRFKKKPARRITKIPFQNCNPYCVNSSEQNKNTFDALPPHDPRVPVPL